MIVQQTAKILGNERVSKGYYRILITCGDNYKNSVPGQFVTLRMPGQNEPLLRRPFSIHRLKSRNNSFQMEILYRVVGRFTKRLSNQKAGDLIDILGPAGHGFSINTYSEPVAIAAGGIGVAPLVFLAERLKQRGTNPGIITVFLGGQTKTDILCTGIFSELGTKTSIATEDGSAGHHGIVTEPLETWLETYKPAMIYACGPRGMLKAVGRIAQSKDISCEVSVETLMACGLGVCMGCAVPTNDISNGYRHACKDGPVFDANVLV